MSVIGNYEILKGSGDVCLIQQYGDSRPNVAHFYGPDAERLAYEGWRKLAWRPTHVDINGRLIPIREWDTSRWD